MNVFIGANGQGKTNLLEAVAMLALSSSPRARKEIELVGPVGRAARIDAHVEGSDIQIAFNARYVLDALGVIADDEVELLFDGPLRPGLLRPPGKEHYLYVIMPVRVAMS